eukprot:691227-Prorocentrum_minimum.AAC.1
MAPDWGREGSGTGRPVTRADRGPTRWPVILVHFPPAIECRFRGGRRGVRGGEELAGAAGARSPLRTLRGEPSADAALLR